MKIFLSWSGDRSKYLAECFKDWLPYVLQYIDPYMSAKDIKLGERWSTNITDSLKNHDFGLVFVTAENIDAPWINFEAGALSKSLQSRLVPIIYDSDLTILDSGPLKQFQSQKTLDRESILDLVKEIHSSSEDDIHISNNIIDFTFEKWWPDLEKKLSDVPTVSVKDERNKSITDKELLIEIFNKVNTNEKLIDTRRNLFNSNFNKDVLEVRNFLYELDIIIKKISLMEDDLGLLPFEFELLGEYPRIVKKANRINMYVNGSNKIK